MKRFREKPESRKLEDQPALLAPLAGAQKIDALRDDSRSEAPVLIRGGDGTFRQSTPVERSGFRGDVLISYQPNPGTVVFAGYGASFGAGEFFSPRDLERTSDGFFVKLSYLFRM